ncbi:MAG: CDP-diacylglycerol--glycerol-3-phosphate 3-phosphatidyltransferase [Gammaproteobacteria bacterium]|nr:CDP-diacylglycerol--glycerol-3-phosphate 3-phosphatidyltransferase [Gammaproteobacteria bacterium]
MPLNVPNMLTMLRVMLIPVFITSFYLPFEYNYLLAAFIFWFAAGTDILDGYLARRLNQSTKFGAFLDPVADKVMVSCALLLITEDYQNVWVTVAAVIMIGREIIISALREWMAELGLRNSVAVSVWGKVKTAAQMLALIALLSRYNELVIDIGFGLLFIATALTVSSMVSYLRAAITTLSNEER